MKCTICGLARRPSHSCVVDLRVALTEAEKMLALCESANGDKVRELLEVKEARDRFWDRVVELKGQLTTAERYRHVLHDMRDALRSTLEARDSDLSNIQKELSQYKSVADAVKARFQRRVHATETFACDCCGEFSKELPIPHSKECPLAALLE